MTGGMAGTEAWTARLQAASLTKATMNRLVMDYLVIEGHKEAAKAFERESRTDAGMDLETISDRRLIRSCVEDGDVASAVRRAEELVPDLLAKNDELNFHVRQQELIEFIRADDIERALKCAQEVLGPLAEGSSALLQELERTMLLLAYADTRACPEAELLAQSQRHMTASRLNAAVLSAQAQETEAALPMMLRRLRWAQDELQQRSDRMFPRIDDYEEAIPCSPASRTATSSLRQAGALEAQGDDAVPDPSS